MTDHQMTTLLAQHVMGWSQAPDRFLTGKRGWVPHSKFRPIERLTDAFRLLDAAKPQRYTMQCGEDGIFAVWVQIDGVTGEARDFSKPRAVSYAIARAHGLEVEENR